MSRSSVPHALKPRFTPNPTNGCTHTDTLQINTNSNHTVYNQHLKRGLLSFSYTLVHTCLFSPFCLFSEVARPLSKVCFAKGRVHFHILTFDMRRPSIQSYVMFFSPASCLSPSSFYPSAHSLIPVPCSTRCLLGGSWAEVTQTITEQLLREIHLPL